MGERAIKEAAEHDREFSEATKIFLIFCSDRKLRSVRSFLIELISDPSDIVF